jgi:hypothetical protein
MARFGSDKWVNILKKINIDKNIAIMLILYNIIKNKNADERNCTHLN